MNKDFTELLEYLDRRFITIDDRFSNIETQLEDKADKADVQNLLNAIDAYATRADTYFQEMVALAHKVERHERWIQHIAEKLGIKLDY